MLTAVAVEGYRSLRSLVLPLDRLTVVTGANGSGKSNLYRVLRLLAAVARDGAVAALAAEGGLPSTLWAGPETISRGMRSGEVPVQGTVRSGPVALRLGFASDDLGYALDLGLPLPATTMFSRDPEIKAEAIWHGPYLRAAGLLVERRGPTLRVRGDDGWVRHDYRLPPWASMLSEAGDPRTAPELLAVRDGIRAWRFFDSVRTDADAPARRTVVGTRTPVLANDAADLAAALQTIRESGPEGRLESAVDRAFPGSHLHVEDHDGRFALRLTQPGLLRPLGAAELSDGTLRYLIWVAALLSTRPAPLLVLNEPETSLHPSLFPALAGLVLDAAADSQLVVVSHSEPLVALLRDSALVHTLRKDTGETLVEGLAPLEQPPWHWPTR
jgi:predicted ATPase